MIFTASSSFSKIPITLVVNITILYVLLLVSDIVFDLFHNGANTNTVNYNNISSVFADSEDNRECEDVLANEIVFNAQEWWMPRKKRECCEFLFRRRKKKGERISNDDAIAKIARERFKKLKRRNILFIGNSVSRRQLYSVAHILGGKNARINAIANDESLQRRYGKQDVYDSKILYHSAFEVSVNLNSGEMSSQHTCLADDVENIADELLAESKSLRCSKKSLLDHKNAHTNNGFLFLGYLYVGSGSKAYLAMEKALDVWIENATNDDSYAFDSYDTIVIQVGLDSNAQKVKDYEQILDKVRKLIDLRSHIRVIFNGVHHHDENNDKWLHLLKQLKPKIREIKNARVLDVTKTTSEGVEAGFLEHEPGSAWHFLDDGRIFLASMLINLIMV